MKIVKFLTISSVFYSLSYILIVALFVIDKTLHSFVNYHPTDYLLWYILYFGIPFFLSFLTTYLFFNYFTKKKVFVILSYLYFIWIISLNAYLALENKDYWGYYFKRPVIFTELKNANKITKAMKVQTSKKSKFKLLVEDKSKYITPSLNPSDYYYSLYSRVFTTFENLGNQRPHLYGLERNILDSNYNFNSNELKKISDLIYKSGVLDSGKKNWDTTRNVSGLIVGLKTIDSLNYIYCAFYGGQVENDHYPRYEFLIMDKNKELKVIKHNKFYVDIAGAEGVEYCVLIFYYNFISLFIFIIVYSVINLIYYFIKKRKY